MTARQRGFTLVEAVVALAVVAIGVVASQRLLVQSARSVAAERAATGAQLAAQALLVEARHGPLPLGRIEGTDAAGIHFEREVRATDHPALRAVVVRTRSDDAAGSSCELVEILRGPIAP